MSSWWWARKRPETCWAVNKRPDNKLENCCIWLVIYLNCTMMHGITNLKLKKNARNSCQILILILLMWRIGWVPNNASRWQMRFKSAFKGLKKLDFYRKIFWQTRKYQMQHLEGSATPVLYIGRTVLIIHSLCSGRIRFDSCSLYPQNEIGPSISSSVVLCVFVLLVYIVVLV